MTIQSCAAQKLPVPPSLFHSQSLGMAAAFSRYGAEIEQLRRVTSMSGPDGVRDWADAKPSANSWEQRILLLWTDGSLQAALFYRERMVFGFGTGLLRGGDAFGETLLLCAHGHRDAILLAAVEALFSSRRRFLLLLDSEHADHVLQRGRLRTSRFQVQSVPVTVHWRHKLLGTFDDSIALLGRRTRRNLRHALRLVKQRAWHCEIELSAQELLEATADLARRSTHPVSEKSNKVRLEMSTTLPGFFAMGLRNANGEWLSTLTGRRQGDGVTDILWQHNARDVDDSLCIVLRGLLMVEEVRRGGTMLRYLGGTNPLMEHCCNPEPSVQVSIARQGLRFWMMQRLMRTSLFSAAHPLRRHMA